MLHRVVMKRSGRPAVAEDASGFTAADHLICTIVRQARNFPVRCWNTARSGGSGVDHQTDRSLSRGVSQTRMPIYQNWHRNFRAKFPWSIKFPDGAGKLFNFPAQLYGKYFFCLWQAPRYLVSHRSVQGRSFPRCIPSGYQLARWSGWVTDNRCQSAVRSTLRSYCPR